MKKILALFMVIFMGFSFMTGCSSKEEQAAAERAKEVVEITDKVFVQQINDIYLNADDYVGKTIKYQGVFNAFDNVSDNSTHCFVYRNGPGCCSYDGTPGFEVYFEDAKKSGSLPENNAWVEVSGILVEEKVNGYPYLMIQVSELDVMAERGQETVTN